MHDDWDRTLGVALDQRRASPSRKLNRIPYSRLLLSPHRTTKRAFAE